MSESEVGRPQVAAQEAAAAQPMAQVMAEMPEVWRRLLIAHVPDRMGRCTACRNSSGSGERWPCSLHRIASDAERLYGLQLGRAVGGD